MAAKLKCWRCGEALTNLILPLSRREECSHCGAEQHVCKFCKEYNPRTTGQCDEERAEPVREKERANFCDYFAPNANAYQGGHDLDQRKQAEDELAALFGDQPKSQAAPADEAQEIESSKHNAKSPEAAAKEALDELFRSAPKKQ